MAYIAADKNGDIHIFSAKPERHTPEIDVLCIWTYYLKTPMKYVTKVNKRICKTIVGKVLTWEDEPVRL